MFPCSSCWPCRLCSHHPKWMMHEKWTKKWKVNVHSSNAALGRRDLDYFTIYSLFLCTKCFITSILSRWAFLLIELHESSPLLWSCISQGCFDFAFVTFFLLWSAYWSCVKRIITIIIVLHHHCTVKLLTQQCKKVYDYEWMENSEWQAVCPRKRVYDGGGLVFVHWVNLFM